MFCIHDLCAHDFSLMFAFLSDVYMLRSEWMVVFLLTTTYRLPPATCHLPPATWPPQGRGVLRAGVPAECAAGGGL
jgi:hypothetical protein